MAELENGGNIVLHVVELLDNESKRSKVYAIKDMKASGFRVGDYGHDCGCQLRDEWEGVYCKRVFLDGFHWKTHKCDVPRVTKANCNSQAAEQLWSRMDHLHFATEYSRPKYRYFMKNYLKWRNNFLRVTKDTDANPAVSHRQVAWHGLSPQVLDTICV